MIHKKGMKDCITIALALALLIPMVASGDGRTIEVPLKKQYPTTANIDYHEGWPQVITGDQNIWGGIISPVISDLDKDGSKELIVTQQGEPSKLYVFEQDGSLKFGVIEMPDYAPYIDPRRFPSISDINNDGLEEIIITSVGSTAAIMIYSHNGTLLYEWEVDYMVSDDLYSSIVLADLNLDNNLELIYGGWWISGSRLVVLDNEGNSIPGFPVLLENIQMSQTNTPAVGNFDEDMDLEIVAISHENNQPVELSNIRAFNTNGSLLWEQEINSLIYNDPSVGDVNHDGFDEVIFTSKKGIHILDRYGEYLLNKSLGYDDADTSNIALADLNGDTNLELIFGYYSSIYAMDYDGTILWSHGTGWNAHYPPVTGDITGDGLPDIVTNSDSNIYAWSSQGDPLNGFPIVIESNAYGACSIDDIDNNGDAELIASADWKWDENNYNEGYIYIWDLEGTYNSSTMEWPMFHHDPQHTGMHSHVLVADANGPYEGVVDESVQFFGYASGGSTPYTWWWNFGDGATSTEQNPTHTYHAANTYTVTLTVTDATLNTSTDTTTATIIFAEPLLTIGNITGGILRVQATIKNIGGAPTDNINWSITLTKGFVLFGKKTTGSIVDLAPSEEQTITSMPIIGLGKTVITIVATTNGNIASKEQNATIVLFFIVIK